MELSWVSWIQRDGEAGTLMTKASYLGSEALPYAVAVVYFCLSQRAGARLGILYAVSQWLLIAANWGLHLPRPGWLDSNIKVLTGTGSFGMPSGHVLSAAVVRPMVAEALGRRWATGVAVVMVLLISFSRVYLGAHFVSDVVAAWGFAGVLIWVANRFEQGWHHYWNRARSGIVPGAPASGPAWVANHPDRAGAETGAQRASNDLRTVTFVQSNSWLLMCIARS